MTIDLPDLIVSDAARAALPDLEAFGFAAEMLPFEPELTQLATLSLDQRIADAPLETLATHSRILPWREAFRTMRLKPSEYRSSIEQLVRRELTGKPAVGATWLIERYNRHSISNLAPMGAYDLDRLALDAICIRPIGPADRFVPLGGDASKMPLAETVLAYVQAEDVLCWALNYRDAAHSALRPETRRALFISEAVDEQGKQDARGALEGLAADLRALGATCSAVAAFSIGTNEEGWS